MKRFKFRLERVLAYRVRLQDEAKEELSRRNFERDAAIDLLEKLERESLRGGIEAGKLYSVADLLSRSDYAVRIKKEIGQQNEKIETLTKLAEEAREAYVEATKEVRVLEQLKIKKQAEYNDEAAKEEIKALDELTTQRFKGG